ncbi:hypothetical protein FB451DRAFT_1387524 [Mycena latifolia]|nr:hypothetical protein FB451DRAFT_1387524 [Mycena latifolia]
MAEDPPTSILPLELERQIFELTAVSRPVSIPNLLRVAWRVKHWVEPLLYRTLVIGADSIQGFPSCSTEIFTYIAFTKSGSFLRDSVQNPMVHLIPTKDIRLIVAQYHALNNDDDPAQWTSVTGLIHLSHLSLDNNKLLNICPHLLNACKSLCALVILHPSPAPPTLVKDPRFVVMSLKNYTRDWQRGILTGDDYWSRADAFIAKRISGEIDRRTFFLNDPS